MSLVRGNLPVMRDVMLAMSRRMGAQVGVAGHGLRAVSSVASQHVAVSSSWNNIEIGKHRNRT